FGAYLGTEQVQAAPIERVRAAADSVAAWWTAIARLRPNPGLAYLATGAAGIVAALAACRGAQLRLAAALLAAAAGLFAATLYHLGGLPSSGEGGRLLYGPLAWLALAIGVALARRTEAAAAMWRVAIALAACAVVAGAALLHVMLREVAAAQADSRALVDALARWASTHEDPVMVVVA